MKEEFEIFEKFEQSIQGIQKILNFDNGDKEKLYGFFNLDTDRPLSGSEVLRFRVQIATYFLETQPSFYFVGIITFLKNTYGSLRPVFEFKTDPNLTPDSLRIESENMDWQNLVKATKDFCDVYNKKLASNNPNKVR